MPKLDTFSFRKIDTIGAADAADDKHYLDTCFVDIGTLEALKDCSDFRRIVLGRTGTGKTATLLALAKNVPNPILIAPESLSIPYIANSNVLTFFQKLGVKLDVFFKLLWRHVLVVELLRTHFKVELSADKTRMLERIMEMLPKDPKHKRALAYLEKYGSSFWLDTEKRVKELADGLESQLKLAAGLKGGFADLSAEASRTWTKEQKIEVVHRAQEVVNSVQIRELTDIIRLTDAVLDDTYTPYHIIIDRLDEEWVDEDIRLRLIRSLIETARDFREIQNAKVIIALRLDLIQRVFRHTKDGGFQEDKYESMFSRMSWTKEQLTELLDRRINELIRHRYTKRSVDHRDVFPDKIDGEASIDYFLEHTLMRPRDVIAFFNRCISVSAGKAMISPQALKEAAGEYSRDRLRALSQEWITDYPALHELVSLMKGRASSFTVKEFETFGIGDKCLEMATKGLLGSDELSIAANAIAMDEIPASEFCRIAVGAFYRAGIVGLKLETFEHATWAFDDRRAVSAAEIRDDTRVYVHRAFWRALGLKTPVHGRG